MGWMIEIRNLIRNNKTVKEIGQHALPVPGCIQQAMYALKDHGLDILKTFLLRNESTWSILFTCLGFSQNLGASHILEMNHIFSRLQVQPIKKLFKHFFGLQALSLLTQ